MLIVFEGADGAGTSTRQESMVGVGMPIFELELVRLADGNFYMNVEADPATEGQWAWLRDQDRKLYMRQQGCAIRGFSLHRRPLAAVDPAPRVACPRCCGGGFERGVDSAMDAVARCSLCVGQGRLEQQVARVYLAQWFSQDGSA